jgi:DNA-binding NtrC family response regulator
VTASTSILVVDDDETMRDLLSRILTKAGFSVTLATDGRSAIKALEQTDFAAVVTDLVMPNKEGLETLVDIKHRWPACKVVIVSGSGPVAGTNLMKVALQFGADAALRKPVEAISLVATLNRVLMSRFNPHAA